MNNLWAEKYRPKDLDNLILSPMFQKSFDEFMTSGEIPHLILSGPPGIGKTSLAKILLRNLDCDVKVLNGSDSRGIDTVRNVIIDFIKAKSFKKFKIVFFDEGEALTKDSWMAMKGVIEKYSNNARFIFTTNFLYKIPEAIRSRCQIFEFPKLDKDSVTSYYKRVLESENIKYDEKQLDKVYIISNGDLRRSLNYLQKNSKTGKLVLVSNEYVEISKLIKNNDIFGLKQYFANNTVEWEGLYRFLYDKIDDTRKLLIIAKYLSYHSHVMDPEINLVGCIIEMGELK